MFNYIINHEYKGKDKFIFIFLTCMLFVLPIILSDSLYMDDKYRLIDGDFVWEDEGRYLTTLIFQLLSLNAQHVFNFFPLTLIIGIVFFSYAIYYVTEKLNIKSTILNISPLFLIICNPFFLQNLSYQFDSIAHLFSIGLILISFFYENKNKNKEILVSILLITCSAFLYQPSINIYIILYCANVIFNIQNKEESLIKYTMRSAIIYISGTLLYYIIYTLQFKYIFEKIYERNKMINISDLFQSYELSTKTLIFILKSFYGKPIFYIICFLSIVLIFTILKKIYKEIKKENNTVSHKIINSIIYLVIPILIYSSLWGPFILLHEKFFNPRDYVVIGSILMLLSYSLILTNKKYNLIKVSIQFLILLNFFSMSYLYGNILNYDNKYITYINDNISRDMEKYHNQVDGKKIFVFGRQGVSRYAKMTLDNNPYFKILLYPDNSNFFKSYDLYVPKVEKFGYVDNVKEWNYICKYNIKPLVSTPTYDIYSFEKYVSIWYKRVDNFCDNIPTDRTNSFKELK